MKYAPLVTWMILDFWWYRRTDCFQRSILAQFIYHLMYVLLLINLTWIKLIPVLSVVIVTVVYGFVNVSVVIAAYYNRIMKGWWKLKQVGWELGLLAKTSCLLFYISVIVLLILLYLMYIFLWYLIYVIKLLLILYVVHWMNWIELRVHVSNNENPRLKITGQSKKAKFTPKFKMATKGTPCKAEIAGNRESMRYDFVVSIRKIKKWRQAIFKN